MTEQMTSRQRAWPRLRLADWSDVRDTLHMWTQIVGKVRMAYAPMVNHWWLVTLYVSSRGLTTSAIPFRDGAFDIEFDFVEHYLYLRANDGGRRQVALGPKSAAAFYAETMDALRGMGIRTSIHAWPNEVERASFCCRTRPWRPRPIRTGRSPNSWTRPMPGCHQPGDRGLRAGPGRGKLRRPVSACQWERRGSFQFGRGKWQV